MAVISKGSSLTITDGASSAAQAIPDLVSIDLPFPKANKIPAPALDQANWLIPVQPGLYDSEELKFSCYAKKLTLDRMYGWYNFTSGPQQYTFVVTSPNTSLWGSGASIATFTGFVTQVSAKFDQADGKIMADVTVQINSTVVVT